MTRRGYGMDCPTTLAEDELDDEITRRMEAEGLAPDCLDPRWDELKEEIENDWGI